MTINLTKTSALARPDGTQLSKVAFQFQWEVSSGGKKGFMARISKARGVDLDASVIAFDSTLTPIGQCSHDNASPFRGAMQHQGDDKRGKGGETIEVDLDRMPEEVRWLVCVLSSYDGTTTFDNVNNATFSVYEGDKLFAETYLPVQGNDTAALMAQVWRDESGEWKIERMAKMTRGKSWRDVAAYAARHVSP